MNPAVKEKWIAALRSGEYEQTVDRLRSSCGFCVLGVLCDLYSKEHKVPWDYFGHGSYFFLNESKGLSHEVMIWSGITSRSGMFILPIENPFGKEWFTTAHLSNLNDIDRLPFKELADLIEKNF